MAVGLVLNGTTTNSFMAGHSNNNNNNIGNNPYDRTPSRFSLNLPIAASHHLVSPSSSSASATNRLRHWDISPTSPNDPSPFEVRY